MAVVYLAAGRAFPIRNTVGNQNRVEEIDLIPPAVGGVGKEEAFSRRKVIDQTDEIAVRFRLGGRLLVRVQGGNGVGRRLRSGGPDQDQVRVFREVERLDRLGVAQTENRQLAAGSQVKLRRSGESDRLT